MTKKADKNGSDDDHTDQPVIGSKIQVVIMSIIRMSDQRWMFVALIEPLPRSRSSPEHRAFRDHSHRSTPHKCPSPQGSIPKGDGLRPTVDHQGSKNMVSDRFHHPRRHCHSTDYNKNQDSFGPT